MKTYALIACILVLVSFSRIADAQEKVEISPPELSLSDEGVVIRYEILNAEKQDYFTILLEITNADGKILPAKSLRGDIGEGISGRGTKSILWNLAADSVFLNEEIFVEITALREQPVVIPPPVAEKMVTEKTEAEEAEKNEKNEKTESISRSTLLLNSLILPGWGLSRQTSNPHWIKGVAAYGCLAGSVVMNRYAYNTYQDYLDPTHPDNKVDTFNDADTRHTVSAVLGYTALAIWVSDLAWTFIATSPGKGMKVSAGLDPVSGAGLLRLSYRF